MATLHDLIVWQLADELRREVIALTDRPALSRDMTLRRQLRDAAGSIGANLAEGYGRQRHAEFARFVEYALGSLAETEEWLRHGHAQSLWSESDLANALRLCKRETAALQRFRAYLRTTKTPT